MKPKLCPFILIISLLTGAVSITGCGQSSDQTKYWQVSAYAEKSIPVKIPLKMEMEFGDGNVDVYSWTKKEAAFEVTDVLIGSQTDKSLDKKLKEFKIQLLEDKGITYVKAGYSGGRRNITAAMNIRVYLPKRIESLRIAQKSGRLRFLDSLGCRLEIRGDKLDTSLNSFKGLIKGSIAAGGLEISEGSLSNGTSFTTGKGNIIIKSELEAGGKYDFKTSSGLIELKLPENQEVTFKTASPMEACEFKTGALPASVGLDCGIGRINISKY